MKFGGQTLFTGDAETEEEALLFADATAQYTYSKALDDAPLMAGGQPVTASTGGMSIAQNWLELGAERVGYGCELSPAHCDVALSRLMALTQEAPVLQEIGQTFAEVVRSRGYGTKRKAG